MTRSIALLFFILLVIHLLSSLPLRAQSDTATLSGRIADESGAVIPAVEVVATNLDSGVKTTAVTNDSGIYVVQDLHPGNYEVTVEKLGFRKVVLTGLTLDVQDALSRNFTMLVGSVTESVVVRSSTEETADYLDLWAGCSRHPSCRLHGTPDVGLSRPITVYVWLSSLALVCWS